MEEQNELFGSFVVRLVVACHNQGERVRPMKRVVIYRVWCRYAEVQEVYASWKANNERLADLVDARFVSDEAVY